MKIIEHCENQVLYTDSTPQKWNALIGAPT